MGMGDLDNLRSQANRLRQEAANKIKQAEEVEKKIKEAEDAIDKAQRAASGSGSLF